MNKIILFLILLFGLNMFYYLGIEHGKLSCKHHSIMITKEIILREA